ncbi:MAG: hypothetical protein ACP6IS_01185 [Candidatus Asgardarchaeia archaeon]
MAYGSFTSVETLAIALWAGVVSYYWELFGYYFIIKWIKDRKMYQISFALFFLLMAIGRVFYVIYDFYMLDMIWWRLGTFFQWLGISIIAVTLSVFLFKNKILRYVLVTIPLIIAILILVVPEANINDLRLYLGAFIAPVFALLIPGLFFYLAIKMRGKVRISMTLQGFGFLVLYMGRIIHASLVRQALPEILYLLGAPAIVIIALLLIVIGIQMLPE